MSSPPSSSSAPKRRYVRAIGPRLRKLLTVVLALFAILAINGVYLSTIRVAEAVTGQVVQNHFSLLMFLGHIVVGLIFILPFVVFGVIHIRNTHDRKNRHAVNVGYALFAAGLVVIVSGIVLVRIEEVIDVRDPDARNVAYWAHVISPFACAWLFVLHRLSGPRIKWRVGGALTAVAAILAVGMLVFHYQDPRQWNVAGPESGEQYFYPSLARTSDGNFIPAEALKNDAYCQECHEDVHAEWENSAHRFSSFNNPIYLFSIRGTRQAALERDGNVQAARFCAGCHDPVPFFSGAFDDPDFDDVNHPTADDGITCTVCHAITHVNSPRGNSDFTIEEPLHYPFARSKNPVLAWINRALIKAKPDLHNKTFLKPLHKSPDFCGACHKVHIPEELNHYKWLRGQNHRDTYHLSGVSGHGITSFYYPEKPEHDCNGCHMPLRPSADFGSRDFDGTGVLSGHDHQFPSANSGIAHLMGLEEAAVKAHEEFARGALRIDLFALREGGTIDGELIGPLRPELPALERGKRYLLETVIRTLKLGHVFPQGTVDSNQIWVELTIKDGDRVIAKSGGRDEDGVVDPWSHFVTAYILDREGNRIERRNVRDIFVPLYDHQIPPGAADVVHGSFKVPADARGPITIEAALHYRKFDTTLLRHVYGPARKNDLPIMTRCTDCLVLPLKDGAAAPAQTTEIPEWQRWNDYGIALLRKGTKGSAKGQLRQAEEAFAEVQRLGRPDGPLNRARVAIKEGRLEDAVQALRVAGSHEPPAPPWSVAWFTGIVNQQNGHLDDAIENFTAVVETRFEEARRRGFDFSQDWRALNRLGVTLFERARLERGEAKAATRRQFLEAAEARFRQVLALDPEDVTAHYNLSRLLVLLERPEEAETHRELHAKYRVDDNSQERAIGRHRAANPAADNAAEAIVIYPLQRRGAFELPPEAAESGDGR